MATDSLTPATFVAVKYSVSTEKCPIVGIIELDRVDQKINDPEIYNLIWVSRKEFKLTPGNVYTIRTNAERTTFGLDAKWAGHYVEPLVAAGWQAAGKAWDLEQSSKALAKRQSAPTMVLEGVLAPLRSAYLDMPEMQRAAFEVWVIRYLRRGG